MAAPFNPYHQQHPIETNTRVRSVIHDTTSRHRFRAGEQIETARYDLAGNRHAEVTNIYVRTQDGRLCRDAVNEPIFSCTSCQRTMLHAAVMRSCSDCGTLTCQSCLTSVSDEHCALDLCPPCYRHWRWSWLFSIGSIRTSLRPFAK